MALSKVIGLVQVLVMKGRQVLAWKQERGREGGASSIIAFTTSPKIQKSYSHLGTIMPKSDFPNDHPISILGPPDISILF